jgi:pyrimidine-nucleoside phosphorylase
VAPRDGFVAALEAELIGRAAVMLGAGRDRLEAVIDPAVGLMVIAPPGTRVRQGEPILEVRHRAGHGLDEARRLLVESIEIADAPPSLPPLVQDRIQGRMG